MKAVLDASAALHAVLPEILQAKALQLLKEYRAGLHELHSPDVFPLETLNAISKAERQKRIAYGAGMGLWKTLMGFAPTFHPHTPLLPGAYSLSVATRTAVYDMIYLHLAELEDCEMITADQRLVSGLKTAHPRIVYLGDLP